MTARHHRPRPQGSAALKVNYTTCWDITKKIARRAGIAFTTVRTHLVNALRKVGCSNRKQLIDYVAEAAARGR